jgi:hypothetical protein
VNNHEVRWLDAGREPQCAPNPAYPEGIDVDASFGAAPVCKIDLPYPARRCGSYVVQCLVCGASAACTTAGRPDDPRSFTLACGMGGGA